VASIGAGNTQYYVQYTYCASDPALVSLVFDKDKAAFTLRSRSCTATNPVRAYVSRIYFVASCSRCDGAGDGIPTLKRIELLGNRLVETPLVEGIETLRFEYGFDTDADGSADTFRTAPAASGEASRWENVVAIKVHYVVRSLEVTADAALTSAQTFDFGGAGTVTSAKDGFVRRAYTSTIRLVNPSSVRESQ
jgi:type IV pilus assembly protein PilW